MDSVSDMTHSLEASDSLPDSSGRPPEPGGSLPELPTGPAERADSPLETASRLIEVPIVDDELIQLEIRLLLAPCTSASERVAAHDLIASTPQQHAALFLPPLKSATVWSRRA